MIIQVNTDGNIEGKRELTERVEGVVGQRLSRFETRVTRVEVHLSDENSNKKPGADDMRCLLEARLSGLQPLAVSHQAETVDQAVGGALDKIVRSIDATLGKLGDR